jgi:MerR family transcriptional regulator, light-induced transcriptional regulator
VIEGRTDEITTQPTHTLTVAAVARRLGVAPATLRTWARRYGLGPSQHTAGSHRRYTTADLTRLLVMRRLTHEGVSPAQAAHLALAEDSIDSVDPDGVPLVAGFGALPNQTGPVAGRAARSDLDIAVPGSYRAGGGRVVPLPQAAPVVRGLARASMALDAHGVSEVLRRAVRATGVVSTWETLATPVLVGLGERYAATNEGIEVEHLFSECLMGVLRATSEQLTSPRNAAPVLLACIGEEQHSLPLHAICAALAERGVLARQLGMRVPPEALVAAVHRSGPGVVLLYAALPVPTVEPLTALARMRPVPNILVGGPGWPGRLPTSVHPVASLHDAVEHILAAVL